jgi:hypothetical protein
LQTGVADAKAIPGNLGAFIYSQAHDTATNLSSTFKPGIKEGQQ